MIRGGNVQNDEILHKSPKTSAFFIKVIDITWVGMI